MSSNNHSNKITIAYGDGIGPEIMESTLKVLDASGASLEYDEIEIGEKVYKRNVESGIDPDSWDKLINNKIFLKAPITTPQGGGFKSLNVTIRKSLGLYANVRPVKALTPYVRSHFPTMDLVVIRENEEDLYAGIEHQQTPEVIQCLKLVSRPGCERIIRYAFEYARSYGRKKVTCMTKDNIMKHTDGLFHKIFDEIKQEYPDIETDHFIIDIGAARLADTPHWFDVIVTLNLYGDIISDITAQISGSVGLGGSANIGTDFAMFEAIHGSAPDIAGQGIANPSGLLHGAVLMLQHIGQNRTAQTIHNAWLKTLEDGIHTGEIASREHTKETVGTEGFADAVIARLGEIPQRLSPVHYGDSEHSSCISIAETVLPPKQDKVLDGVDVFLDWSETTHPSDLAAQLNAVQTDKFALSVISTRGLKAWPDAVDDFKIADHWCCRFTAKDSAKNAKLNNGDIAALLSTLHKAGFDVVKTENLYSFDGQRGYSVAQGE